MERESNLEHWQNWANSYGPDLLSTTKCSTIKRLEITALLNAIHSFKAERPLRILEIGCGSGLNLVALCREFPNHHVFGVDFSSSMIGNAEKNLAEYLTSGRELRLDVADARYFQTPWKFKDLEIESFDIIFTNRMLINLSSSAEQLAVMERIAKSLSPNGQFLMLENSVQTHKSLNRIRELLGLPFRRVAEFNVFIDEDTVITPFKNILQLESIEYVSGLHDLLLYAVDASTRSEGTVEYDSPLMKNLTMAIEHLPSIGVGPLNNFGQNVLWSWRKKQ